MSCSLGCWRAYFVPACRASSIQYDAMACFVLYSVYSIIRVLAIYKIVLFWNAYKYYYETVNSPTQGQPNPRKCRII